MRARVALLVGIAVLPLLACSFGLLCWLLPLSRDGAQGAAGRAAAGGAALVFALALSLAGARACGARIERALVAEAGTCQAEHEARERAEAEKAAAQTADRSKDFFLAMLSHELRGTLTAVIGWLEIGRVHAEDRAIVVRALDIALRNAQQEARLMDDLLDVSRILAGQFALEYRPVNLSRLAREALEAARPSAEQRHVALALRTAEPLFVEGDRGRLLQAIGNLLGNGIKFNRAGGRVELALERSGRQARLTVEDDGAGIEAEALPHIFERFWQGDAAAALQRRGLGLGLPLVRHIVEMHGGEVRAESGGRGKGARFTMELPLMPSGDAIAVEGRPSREDAGLRLNGLAVVAVDRNEDTLGWLQYLLATHGAMTWKARSVDEALSVVRREAADVLIADVADVDEGYALVRALRSASAHKHIAAVALSSRPSEEECHRALAAGYDSFIAKPCDPYVLVRAVGVAAHGGGP